MCVVKQSSIKMEKTHQLWQLCLFYFSPLQWHGEIFLVWQRRTFRPLLPCPWVAFTDRRHKCLCQGAAGPSAGRALWRCPASAGLNQGRASSSSLGLCGSERPGLAALHGTRTSLGCIRTHSSEGPTHVIWTQTEFFPGNHTVRPVMRNCDPASSCLSLFESADRSGLGPYRLQYRCRNLSPAVPAFPKTWLVLLKNLLRQLKLDLYLLSQCRFLLTCLKTDVFRFFFLLSCGQNVADLAVECVKMWKEHSKMKVPNAL